MYTIRSIIPCNMLVDTDMGLIKVLQFLYQGDERYYPGIMKLLDVEENELIQYVLIHRDYYNPLSAIMKSEFMVNEDPDKLYEDLYRKHEEEILRLSTSTAIFDMVCKTFFVSNTIQFKILCNSELEKAEFLRRIRKLYNTDKIPADIEIVDGSKTISTKDFGNVYVKDIHELNRFNQPLEGKNILIGSYDFNREYNDEDEEYMNLPLIEFSQKYMSTNKLLFIDVYPKSIEDKSQD